MNRENQENLYTGLLGLDNLNPTLKVINFAFAIVIGVVLAFNSWSQELYFNHAIYEFEPFSWPIIFLFAWPICAVILWLRITGLKWRWGFLAGILVISIYFILNTILTAIAWMMS